MRVPNDLLHGTLDALVLKTLSWGPMHGYAISRWIEHQTGGILGIQDAALYKCLHRLRHAGAITADWGVSESGRKARFYRLTTKGRAQLRVETTTWHTFAGAIFHVLDLA